MLKYIIILFLIPSFAVAKELTNPESENGYFEHMGFKSYVIDTGVDGKLPSPRALVANYSNFVNLTSLAYTRIEKVFNMQKEENKKRRAFVVLAELTPFRNLLIHQYFSRSGQLLTHEYAHRTRDHIFKGRDYAFNPKYLPFGDNPYSYAYGIMFKGGRKAGSSTWENGTITYSEPSRFVTQNEGLFHHYAGGINQEVNLAGNLASRMSFSNSIDIAAFRSYYSNSLSFIGYHGDSSLIELLTGSFGKDYSEDNLYEDNFYDPQLMIKTWRDMGRNYSPDTIANNQLFSFLLSGTTWSFARGMYSYVKTGKRYHEPLRFKKLRLPDFYHYFNIGGPSIKAVTDYQIDKTLYITASYESIYDKGGVAHTYNDGDDQEASLGFAKSFYNDKFSLVTSLIYGMPSGKIDVQSEFTIKPTKLLTLSFGTKTSHMKTLSGIRDISTKDSYGAEIFGRLYLTF